MPCGPALETCPAGQVEEAVLAGAPVRKGTLWRQTSCAYERSDPEQLTHPHKTCLLIYTVEISLYHIFSGSNVYRTLNALPWVRPSVHDYHK